MDGQLLIDIGEERAVVDGKAQLALGNLEFDDVDVKLLAGDPHLKFSRRYDLATGIGSASDYLKGSQSIYKELSTNPLDPYDRLGEVIRIAATVLRNVYTGYPSGGMGGGGFGGQGQIGYGSCR